MFDAIVKRMMANIPQYTQLFDTYTQNTTCVTQNNTILIDGINGEYTISGGVDGVATKSCLNDLHSFENGVAVAQCFFGNDQITHNIALHKVNVGTAIKRDFALEMMVDKKINNIAIVYWDATQNTQNDYKYTISQDNTQMIQVRFGVMYKIKASDLQLIGGCNDVIDKVIANSVIETGDENKTLIRFDSVKDRFFAEKFYCVDMAFSYLEDMKINDIIKDRVKHFEALLDDVKIN